MKTNWISLKEHKALVPFRESLYSVMSDKNGNALYDYWEEPTLDCIGDVQFRIKEEVESTPLYITRQQYRWQYEQMDRENEDE